MPREMQSEIEPSAAAEERRNAQRQPSTGALVRLQEKLSARPLGWSRKGGRTSRPHRCGGGRVRARRGVNVFAC